MIKVIHNNSCPKSRAILEYLDENGIKFQIIDICKEPLSRLEIQTLLKKLSKKAAELVQGSAEMVSKYFGQPEDITEEKALDVITNHPELIQCPILIKEKVAMAGNPVENVKFFIEN